MATKKPVKKIAAKAATKKPAAKPAKAVKGKGACKGKGKK